ncbi:MAG: M14 family zinc carboxypeptidase [candidate division KSB1 bacterium]|nr:M14 family zinc carboxypeptidase [candidate division KSB1 bacterium]
MSRLRSFFIVIFLQVFPAALSAQAFSQAHADFAEDDPCGYDSTRAMVALQKLGHGWGYDYDSLLVDLKRWAQSPYVQVDSIGASVQNRALWLLTITDTDPATEPVHRVWIHARTHPNEVQGWWVTNEIINILLSETPLGRTLRQNLIVHIMPMYNPDGVELGHPRENANGVDIESNWNATTPEPEVQALRGLFETFMATPLPIRVALNMHASYRCKRFFVYHHANGTSPAFAEDQKVFIGDIRAYWPDGIENWDYFVSWKNGTPRVYPESWFWINHREAVMALTYEDMNCSSAGDYDRSAQAILAGVRDYLNLGQPTGIALNESSSALPRHLSLDALYPNPISDPGNGILRFYLPAADNVSLIIYDMLGRRMQAERIIAGRAGWQRLVLRLPRLAAGRYWLVLRSRFGTRSQGFAVLN